MFVIYYTILYHTCMRHCAISRKIAGSIPDCLIGIFSLHNTDRPWGPSSLLYNVYRVSPGGRAAGALTADTHLGPRLKKE